MVDTSRALRTAAQCMRAAVDLENRAAELYDALALRFQDHPVMRKLLLDLAGEERQHAMRLRLLDRYQPTLLWPAEVLGGVGAGLQRAIDVVTEARDRAAGAEPMEPTAVLDEIVEIEKQFASVHAEMMTRSLSPEVRKLFDSLSVQDTAHRDLLQSTREKLARVAGPR